MSTDSRTQGISILGWLGILFVGLKLTKFIDWSWWYVLLPFYGTFLIIGLIMIILLIRVFYLDWKTKKIIK